MHSIFSPGHNQRESKVNQKPALPVLSSQLQLFVRRRKRKGGKQESERKISNRPHRPEIPLPWCPHPGNFVMFKMGAEGGHLD